MEVAWHMVKADGPDVWVTGLKRFASTYPELMATDDELKKKISRPHRIYVGDEFCPARLPNANEFSSFLRFADEKKLPLTLLTPVLTDPGINGCKALFDRLNQWNPCAEVVVNDLGVLFYLKKAYPGFQLSMGRLFNKGFKDPRLKDKDHLMSKGATSFLNHCSFKQKNIRDLAETLDIKRFEQDLLPYADPEALGQGGLKTSVYFPFGYVTTGRACFMAGVVHNPDARFKFNNGCTSPCTTHALQLKDPYCDQELIQNGNTIFYRYTPSMMSGILKKARSHGLRLVYQGGLA